MKNKMTSGEIAKKAGVSQKAVRLYDEKGLLKPTEYSEGNYRLYDKAALEILEKIVALKQIGFSLEEIKDNLTSGEAKDVAEALRIQLKNMEEKRYQLDKVIQSINRTLQRKGDDLDWDDVAEIVSNVGIDQKADERHWDALRHTSTEKDWYVKTFEYLDLKEGSKVLDLGVGYAKLWRNNRDDIPRNTKVFGYDIHGSWADDFEKYVKENEKNFPEGVEIKLEFEDIEKEKAWKKIKKEKEYDYIIAHYIYFELKDAETLIKRASEVLASDGTFSFNGEAVNTRMLFFKDAMKEVGIKAPFIDEIIKAQKKSQDECEAMLRKYFKKAEPNYLQNRWHYTDASELLDKMKELFPGQEKFVNDNEDKILDYFEKKIKKEKELIMEVDSLFWRCSK